MKHESVARLLNSVLQKRWALAGVPCSTLEPWFESIDSHLWDHAISAPNEGEATAICAGTWLAGGQGVAFMQNSGLGNAINVITSMLSPFEIPALFIIGWRGEPGRHDEPQHRRMGAVTQQLLDLCGVRILPITDDTHIDQIVDALANRTSCAFLVPTIDAPKSRAVPSPVREREDTRCVRSSDLADGHVPTRNVLETCCDEFDLDSLFVATTGFCSRELYSVGDGPNKFYMPGSMGHALALGFGIANHSKRRVVVLDGDGALLMRMGSLSLSRAFPNTSVVHVLLNNGIHESTGCQPLCGGRQFLFNRIASACGFENSFECRSQSELAGALHAAHLLTGPTFIEVFVGRRTDGLPRLPDSLPALAERFRSSVTSLVAA